MKSGFGRSDVDASVMFLGVFFRKNRVFCNYTRLASLGQLERHQCRRQEIPGSIPTGGNFFAEFILFFSYVSLFCQFCIFKGKLDYEIVLGHYDITYVLFVQVCKTVKS